MTYLFDELHFASWWFSMSRLKRGLRLSHRLTEMVLVSKCVRCVMVGMRPAHFRAWANHSSHRLLSGCCIILSSDHLD